MRFEIRGWGGLDVYAHNAAFSVLPKAAGTLAGVWGGISGFALLLLLLLCLGV